MVVVHTTKHQIKIVYNTLLTFSLLSQTFSGSVTSGNITLPSTDVTYTIQVTASVEDGDDINEGVPSRDVMFSLPELGVFYKLKFNYLSEFCLFYN